ncbi:M15 family metallopeptidase [Candidatus Saccharibacteria bacterium]|nr:M15 family metallopeptidase [Candidatus Saccharibacteria bacterium]
MPKKLLILLGVIILAVSLYFGWLKFHDVFTEIPLINTSNSENEETVTPELKDEAPAGFDKTKYALDKSASPWWVVNKTRPLPAGYVPADLAVPDVRLRLADSEEQMKFSKSATADLIAMFKAAEADDVQLVFGSGYRSEALQRQFYNSYVAQDGKAAADRYSARPGTSEHQTGLAFDATSVSQNCHLEICYANLPEGMWLAANAHEYGFILRYPDGKESITGYQYEPWHLRWVGTELATEMNNSSAKTLEEFFGLPVAPDYL